MLQLLNSASFEMFSRRPEVESIYLIDVITDATEARSKNNMPVIFVGILDYVTGYYILDTAGVEDAR